MVWCGNLHRISLWSRNLRPLIGSNLLMGPWAFFKLCLLTGLHATWSVNPALESWSSRWCPRWWAWLKLTRRVLKETVLRTETSALFGNDANASNDSLTLMKPVVWSNEEPQWRPDVLATVAKGAFLRARPCRANRPMLCKRNCPSRKKSPWFWLESEMHACYRRFWWRLIWDWFLCWCSGVGSFGPRLWCDSSLSGAVKKIGWSSWDSQLLPYRGWWLSHALARSPVSYPGDRLGHEGGWQIWDSGMIFSWDGTLRFAISWSCRRRRIWNAWHPGVVFWTDGFFRGMLHGRKLWQIALARSWGCWCHHGRCAGPIFFKDVLIGSTRMLDKLEP